MLITFTHRREARYLILVENFDSFISIVCRFFISFPFPFSPVNTYEYRYLYTYIRISMNEILSSINTIRVGYDSLDRKLRESSLRTQRKKKNEKKTEEKRREKKVTRFHCDVGLQIVRIIFDKRRAYRTERTPSKWLFMQINFS